MISKLLCKIGFHRWNRLNCCIFRLETESLVLAEAVDAYNGYLIKEIIHYDICKSCKKIRIDAHYKWKPGTKRFGDNLIHDNLNNGSIETVVREYLKSEIPWVFWN